MANVAITRAEGAVGRHLGYDPVRLERTEYYPQLDAGYRGYMTVLEAEETRAVFRRLREDAPSELQLQHIPIRSIASLAVDYDGRSGSVAGAFGAATVQVEGEEWWPNYDGADSGGNRICRDGVLRSLGTWPTTPGTVRVVYTAGYTAAELHGQDTVVDASPIMGAVIDEAARRVKKAMVWAKSSVGGFHAGPFTSEKLGDYSYTIDASLASKMFGGLWDLMPETTQQLETFVNWGWPRNS